jgi:16S rRNA (guanine527-N7)-methyltransferase
MSDMMPPPLPQPLPAMAEQWQATLGWQPTAAQQDLFQRLYQTIVETNRSLNLTRITEPTEFWEKHLWDSLRGIQAWLPEDPESLNVVDIGTGAGFPGLPIAMIKPHWKCTLVDSTRKKVKFVQETAEALGLTGVTGLSDRAEQLGHSKYYREAYDLATIRAVAGVSVCAEYVAVAQLGGRLDRVEIFETPLSQSMRACVYLKKLEPTSHEFPRAIGIPTQMPL